MKSKRHPKSLRHNGEIAFWKFAFAMMVFAHHFYIREYSFSEFNHFSFWHVAVEFFFIVSGFYMARQTLKISYHGVESQDAVYYSGELIRKLCEIISVKKQKVIIRLQKRRNFLQVPLCLARL